MNPLPLQAGLSALGCLAMLRLLQPPQTATARLRRLVKWGPVFAGSIGVVWYPDLATRFARVVGVARGVDAVLYVSIAVLAYLVVKLYSANEKQDQIITRLVTEMALIEGERK